MDFISDLPDELSLLILSFIPPTSPSILYTAQCCHLYNSFVNDSVLWKQHLRHHFPHLKESIFCLKCYLNNATPEDAVELMVSRDLSFSLWTSGLGLERIDVLVVPPGEYQKYFHYCWRLLKELSNSHAKYPRYIPVFDFGIAINDFALLRWLLSKSCFNELEEHKDWSQSAFSMYEMSKIAKAFPNEFPSVRLSQSESEAAEEDIRIPVCSEYVCINGYENKTLPRDLTFNRIGNNSSSTPIKRVMLYLRDDSRPNIIAPIFRSLNLNELTNFVIYSTSRDDDQQPLISFLCFDEMGSLQRLFIQNCGIETPDIVSISTLGGLKSLSLHGCGNLREIPECIGNLLTLETLIVRSCFNLAHIHPSIGKLSRLESFEVSFCPVLNTIPSSIGDLVQLERLVCCGSRFDELPSSIGGLVNCKYLDLCFNYDLCSLPSSLGDLRNLKVLNLHCSRKLTSLPSSLGGLLKLEELHLGYCFNLEELPSSIGRLVSLKMLILSVCKKLRELPLSMGDLRNLEVLDVRKCAELSEIPSSIEQLEELRNLKVRKNE